MKTEREVDLLDLCWEIILRWKAVLLCALIGAVLVAGGKYYSDLNNWKNQEVDTIVTAEDIQMQMDALDLTENEIAEVQELIDLNEQILEAQNYYNCSYRMQMNADNLPVHQMRYYVKINQIDAVTSMENEIMFTTTATDIANLYAAYLLSDEVIDLLQSQLPDNQIDLHEVIVPVIESSAILTINLYKVDGLDVEQLAASINEVLSNAAEKYLFIDEYDFLMVEELDTVLSDEDLASEQTERLKQIYDMQTQVNALKSRLSDNQTSYYQLYQTAKTTEENAGADLAVTETKTIAAKPGIVSGNIILGILLGIFLACMYIAICYILSNRLHSANDLNRYYQVTLYGQIETKEHKKGLFVPDGKLNSWRQKRERGLSNEGQIKETVAAIALSCQQKAIQSIALIGTQLDESTDELREIAEGLKERGITAYIVSKFLYDGEALELCAKIKNVILVEQKGQSQYKDIMAEIAKANNYQIEILGGIILSN
jgi:capsular polysaccharide biosynthesis protein